MLHYKEDWEAAQPHFIAWWRGEILDRVALAVRAPRDVPLGETADLPEPEDVFTYWTDPDYRLGQAQRVFNRTAYLGEAFPFFAPHIGPGSMALYVGSQPTLDKRTVWYNPITDDLTTPLTLRYDPDNEWWRINQRLVEESVCRGRGRFLTTHPDIIENLDIVASLRGTQELLVDLCDHPDSVHVVQRQVLDLYFRYFDEVYDLISPVTPGGGCASLFQVWGPGSTAKVQCDFAAMISPRTFEAFVAPYLDEQCRRLNYSVFHLDGPHCICHVDVLLNIPRLNAIQWTPGAGVDGTGSPRWYDLYRKILRGGKSVLILGTQPNEVEPLVRELGPEGLFISTTVASEAEGRALLAAARTWTGPRKKSAGSNGDPGRADVSASVQ
ncbi:MAG: hypothetical protein HYY04_01865 [Chloroflexi bacterium]|nr:hypothetical protein [Chloroflexota bacterium]